VGRSLFRFVTIHALTDLHQLNFVVTSSDHLCKPN